MNIIEKAFYGLFPNRQFNYDAGIKYSGRFSSYNANLKFTIRKLDFRLSREWRYIDEDIKIGLLQSLMAKVFKTKKQTINMDLYNIFIRNIHSAVPKDRIDHDLEKSFDQVNNKYFLGLVEKPNLVWGRHSTTKLGSYDYHTDTITVSSIFRNTEFVDYIVFHEMLHKVHKFKVKNGRSYHHSRIFKQREKDFDGAEILEKQLSSYIRKWKKTSGRPKKRRILGLISKKA